MDAEFHRAAAPSADGRAARLVLGWKLRGLAWPHPYFDAETRKPNRPVSVLSREEREKLRPLCGRRAMQ